ncbi:Ribosomal protein L22, bacterial-type [Candidatus Desulfofervidus auxilii]|uniref:Large ribosomal subunit protein uL22 n=1 Tax=Desulfofervidus auxilii TaxID=1621989 RepID=A0A7C1ZRN1_DESA2|nr:50S ribosomal protein L22 [Candidatus Desulfofervidus auxilii]CAD7770989.1 MAG: 50S ribosomal protein L22 [Candidatus Methanoperedenaceae archaeon GB50]CAD7772479.1 50S ribosomal protein L22 [Candidatus Methanoperedenaceae archaeon GB37]AMM40282.1 Ribosomal protein L22, bacterial-type [Candidatus Desulfofervidus auxilii]CAD7771327.1 50S ribosomal protein L22 [Candidatus Methanoperedenaceae archaeon GB50]CAD7782541.1 MAG: 50S ribosomal protein L22 [Candidatus Methanoperedenaceae archaeon GB3
METRAVAKYVRISPHKVRLVTNILVGKKVAEALGILKFTPKRAAKVVEKTIKSAVANAEQHPDVDVDNLYVKQIYADPGPILKRIRPRAVGRAYRIRKRTSHIVVILDELM